MDSIKKPPCNSCGGECENFVCLYCGAKNEEYEKIVSLIFTDNIDDFYEKNIAQVILRNEKLTDKAEEVFCFLLKNDMIPQKRLYDANIFINILNNNKLITYETFEEVLKCSMVNAMKCVNGDKIKGYKPKCFITELDGARGSAYDKIFVDIDKNVCRQFYENGDIRALITFYHELRHILQNICMKIGEFDEDLLLMIKEHVIGDNISNYYEGNYYDISYELDARKFGVQWVVNLLELFGLRISESFFEELKENYIMENDSKERKVIIDGKEVYKTVDELFDEMIVKNPKYLDLYPQLKVGYIVDNGKVRKKTIEELGDTLIESDNKKIDNYIEKLIHEMNMVQRKV